MNRLSHEKSPYLRMHGENPVDWYPWGREAFDAARTLDRPILLSIGYSACHWCHVIARESFEDEGIAAQLNADFISVKVDREERPDIDAVYMDAVQLSTGSGGWPMTLLLLPDGRPFFAATYLPRDAMERVLAEAAALWQEGRAALVEDAGNLTAQMRAVASRDVPPCAPSPSVTARAIAAFSSAFDSQWGGFGSAPKFPSAPNLLFLLAHHAQTGDDRALSMAVRTLDAMARGGIYDAIGGGFCRYSVDRQWLVPHFEKMLYDNALLLWAYARAWEITGKALYREVALRTADYVLRELTGPEGEFYCAQDADSEGAEGAFYTFTRAELFDLLGEADGRRFCDAYGITDAGNFEGVSIPNRIGRTEETTDAAIDALRRRVYEYRRTRRTLHRDDKVLTSWNALMIVGLCESARILNQPEHLQAARRAERFLRTHLLSAKGEPLLRWRDGEARGDGVLSDYALYALALIELHEAAGDADLLPRAEALAQRMLDLFSDGSRGLFLYGSHGEPLITRPKDIWDAAIPSGNACAALVLKKLAAHTQDEHWRRAAESQLRFVAGAARESPLGCGFGLYAIAQNP